jgi:hypothetical protein
MSNAKEVNRDKTLFSGSCARGVKKCKLSITVTAPEDIAITDVDTLKQKILYSPSTSSFSTLTHTNTFCQLDLAASVSHNTASFDFGAVAVDAGAGPSVPVVRDADAGCGGATSLASANPPPTRSSSRAIATVPLSRTLPPDRMTSSRNHAARCESTIETCSPARDKRSEMS